MKIIRWFVTYKFHLLFWFLVITFAFVTYYNSAVNTYAQVANALTACLLLTIPFYCSAYILVPRLLYKRRFTAFIIAIVSLIISSGLFILLVTRIIDHVTQHTKTLLPEWKTLGPSINLFIWDSVLSCYGATSFKILIDRFRIEKKLFEVEKEKITTELSFLRSQINPHFLFNVMNTIYFQIDKTNVPARLSVEKLSEMLRYQLYECTTDKIGIQQELLYIKNYVAIQTLRMEEDSDVQLLIDHQMENFLIAPLLILPIVENAFKHVSNFKEASKNKIHITLKKQDKNTFLVEAVNSYDQSNVQKHLIQAGGLGIQNLKRRLELLYPERYELNINKEAGTFQTILKLQYDN